MSRLLLGAIGHVDHGKTALVHALTGMDTDRLPEEKRRGISIALGFAHFTLDSASATMVDIIDMPGHERFVRTMVSGATGINAVLLVVAANEGIKPQTVEHVDIAALLGLRRAVIAISKADLATPAEAAAVGREAAALAARAGLQGPPPVLTAAPEGLGVAELKAAIGAVLREVGPAVAGGVPYLPVDRAFSVAGHGTVVTGTLRGGPLATGDEVELVPSGPELRVRGLQVHGAKVAVAQPGQRVAVNLRGVEAARVPRGAALAACGALPPSEWLSVELRAVADAAPLRNTARLRLLLGTQDLEARLRLLDRDALEPGETALAQLRCATPVAVPAREQFVLRIASPARTVAGGRILDAETVRLRRHAPAVLEHLAALAAAGPEELVAREVTQAGAGGIALRRLARLAGLAPARLGEILQLLPVVLTRGRMAVSRQAFEAILAQLPGRLAAHPDGLPRDKVPPLLPAAGAAVLDEALARLVAAGTLRQEGGSLRVPRPAQEHARARQEAAQAARIAEALRQGGLSPPDPHVVAPDPHSRRLLDALVRAGVLVRAADRVQKRDVLFHRDAIASAQRILAPLLATPPGLLVKEAGAALGISRKFSVPLLEHLDAIHFTRRAGDHRVLAARRDAV
ncbi:selenocysteine-specific translation elongation factor [Roseomonas sp. M0104]|uniref:Selenocysteine-specific translation elongation factor n=1 Tax=Teichococcus coralli TaxID=2545983 RepID=A0A845BHA1_9PROT|nr:selenocysteine-specific translation elongation factor [Pseudoroseomonas coralli]MXP65460.1 selenocysteine-specific translation elongation factor [Pseudoroseomonas coralli]